MDIAIIGAGNVGTALGAGWGRRGHHITMNQVGFGLMDLPRFRPGPQPVMFVAGGGAGKPTVLQLVGELGFEAIDAGGLQVARLLEPYAMLWIHLSLSQGQGSEFAFALLRK